MNSMMSASNFRCSRVPLVKTNWTCSRMVSRSFAGDIQLFSIRYGAFNSPAFYRFLLEFSTSVESFLLHYRMSSNTIREESLHHMNVSSDETKWHQSDGD